MGVTATARGKWNVFLPVVAAIRVLALVALNFHADYHLLATDGETYEVANPKAVLDQMQMATLGTTFYRSFVSTCKIMVLPLYSSRVHWWL